jgi:hypothetical protein
LGEEDVRQQLTEAFQECGEVSSVRLPTDRETGALKGIAFIEFASPDGKVGFAASYTAHNGGLTSLLPNAICRHIARLSPARLFYTM